VDDNYLRESVMTPNARIVRGFNPNVMPSYAGQLQEVEMTGIIKYIESLK
jgi:cytochrome c oxidase subunit 2